MTEALRDRSDRLHCRGSSRSVWRYEPLFTAASCHRLSGAALAPHLLMTPGQAARPGLTRAWSSGQIWAGSKHFTRSCHASVLAPAVAPGQQRRAARQLHLLSRGGQASWLGVQVGRPHQLRPGLQLPEWEPGGVSQPAVAGDSLHRPEGQVAATRSQPAACRATSRGAAGHDRSARAAAGCGQQGEVP